MRMLKPQKVPQGRHNEYIVIYIYMWLNLSFSSGGTEVRVRKGSVSYGPGADFSLCLVGDCLTAFSWTGHRKQRGTIYSSRHKRSAGRNIVLHRHGTTPRQSVQEVPLSALFFFSLSGSLPLSLPLSLSIPLSLSLSAILS